MSNAILPHRLPEALEGYPNVKILSLDCFDTLLWRDCHAPRDLFDVLPDTSVPQRQWAEMRSRNGQVIRKRQNEVSIEEIYREMLPNGTSAERKAAIQAELDAEARHCFAFVPTVELMREAKRRGLKIIIVSDTYLNADQLRGLIAAAAGEEVAGMIDRLFCSSVYGKSKGEGLYEPVLKALGVPPQQILHIGDNAMADVAGVAPFGVNTIHLKQFAEATEQRLRLESAIGGMFHPIVNGTPANVQPHRAALAAIEPQLEDDAEAFGFSSLGPVMVGFDRWIAAQAETLRARHGGKVHHLFLMRDGHLPRLVRQAAGGTAGHGVEISRFTAIASSLTSEAAVERYLQLEITSNLEILGRQLLLPKAELATILKDLSGLSANAAAVGFLKAVRQPARMRGIIKRARGFADRLVAHVRRACDPAPGDTLMLIDLGYNGSVQNDVEPVLRKALKVQVAGRYLLYREQFRAGLDKAGFLGPDHYDAYSLESLCANVAVLEQICTVAQGSVIDYETDGSPIRRGNSIKARQSAVRDRIQAGVLRFVREQRAVVLRRAEPDMADLWRRGAASVLARLMFLPMASELAVLGAFEHDVNLGGDDTVQLFSPEIARKGLKSRGLLYMKGSDRMYLPAELHGEGLELKLALLASKRFGMALKYADFVDRTIRLPVILADGTNVSTGHVTATPTHDGYYVAPVAIGDCRFAVGLQFGQLFDWLQVESATFMSVERFLSDKQRPGLDEIEARPSLEGMQQSAPHLFRCEDEHAFMMVPPPTRQDDRAMMLAVVFRPIAERQKAPALAADVLNQARGVVA